MVFCSCRKTTNTSNSTTPRKQRFSLFRRKKPELAYITTDLDDNDDTPTPSELKKLKSVKKSKAHVDRVLYRNRHSGRKVLLSGDGVVLFSGFVDWVSRKRLREKQSRGGRYDLATDKEAPKSVNGGKETVMISRVQRIDPVKSGFMGKKMDRDEETGCAAGSMAAAQQWAGEKSQSIRPKEVLVTTPRKGASGGGGGGGGVDDSFATASTAYSPMSNKSVSFMEENSPENDGNANKPEDDVVVEEDGWCGAFGSSIPTEEEVAGEQQIANTTTTSEPIEDYSRNNTSATATDEESVWCDVFNTSTIVTEGEEGEVVTTMLQEDEGEEDDPNAKIRGIQNVEVVFEERKSLLKRVSTLGRKKKKENSYDQLQ